MSILANNSPLKSITRSFELNWLARYDKTISLPEFVMIDRVYNQYGVEIGGYLVEPSHDEWFVNDKYYDLKSGLIVIAAYDRDDNEIQECIAHEWRHLMQFQFRKKKVEAQNWSINTNQSYKGAIIQYFSTSITEMDALLYSLHKAPSDLNRTWYQWLVDAGKLKHIKNLG